MSNYIVPLNIDLLYLEFLVLNMFVCACMYMYLCTVCKSVCVCVCARKTQYKLDFVKVHKYFPLKAISK